MPISFFNANKRSGGTNPTKLEAVTIFSSSAMLQHISRGSRTRALDLLYFLSPAQPGTAALAKASQVCPGLLPLPQPAARPSNCPVIYTSAMEVSSAPKLQRCYSPKCQDRGYNVKVGKFTCWAQCSDMHTEKKPSRMKSKQLNWYKKGHFP